MNEEAHAGAAVVCGEEEVHEVAGADQELGRLRAVILSDQRGRVGRPVSDFQRVIVDFSLESVEICAGSEEQSCINLLMLPKYFHAFQGPLNLCVQTHPLLGCQLTARDVN